MGFWRRTLLAELGWSPSRLADAVNALLGPGYVARSTVSGWVHQDRVPRYPLPSVVAHLISDTFDGRCRSNSCGAGWIAHDAGKHGLSHRYFTSGLHTAHTSV